MTSTTTTTTVAPCVNGETTGTHTFAGREYNLALPAADGARHPMIVLFHGFSSSKDAIDADTGMPAAATKRGYVVATPNGAGNPRSWSFVGSKDFDFAQGLVAHLERTLCVDSARVFLAGHSAGSAFVGFLVCHKPYGFAAVAMVSATIPSSCPANVKPAVIGVHGTKDPVVLYNGGLGQGQTVPIPPFLQTIAKHAQRSGCNGSTTDKPAPDVERVTYNGCHVESITVVGGGHPWPGGIQATHIPPVVHYSATTAILDFFDAVR